MVNFITTVLSLAVFYFTFVMSVNIVLELLNEVKSKGYKIIYLIPLLFLLPVTLVVLIYLKLKKIGGFVNGKR